MYLLLIIYVQFVPRTVLTKTSIRAQNLSKLNFITDIIIQLPTLPQFDHLYIYIYVVIVIEFKTEIVFVFLQRYYGDIHSIV